MTPEMRGWYTAAVQDCWSSHRERFEYLYAGRETDIVPAVAGRTLGRSHGLWGTNEIDMLHRPEEWLNEALTDAATYAHEAVDERTFRPLVIDLDALGTHFIDTLFGAAVSIRDGQVWSEPLEISPGELRRPTLEGCEVYQRALQLARKAVEASQGQLFIAMPCLSCPINIAVNLFGQRMLFAIADAPYEARHALSGIAEVIAECMRGFMGIIPANQRLNSVGAERYAPPGFGAIDGCATQLVSARHYREFIAPLDAMLLRIHPNGGQIHLCGAHRQHIPIWCEMPELRSVQLNDRALDDLEAYFHGLREDQIIYAMPTGTMPVAKIMDITGGKRLVLQALVNG